MFRVRVTTTVREMLPVVAWAVPLLLSVVWAACLAVIDMTADQAALVVFQVVAWAAVAVRQFLDYDDKSTRRLRRLVAVSRHG